MTCTGTDTKFEGRKEDYEDITMDGWMKGTEGLGPKYTYTNIQGERWFIVVWVISGNKAVRIWNEDIGEV